MKKLLLMCNGILPPVADALGLPQSDCSCGWLWALVDSITKGDEYRLTVLFPYSDFIKGQTSEIDYYGFVKSKADASYFFSVLDEANPDLIHISGTEFRHTYSFICAIEQKGMIEKTSVSIQGLISAYAKHYYADLPAKVINSWTIRDILRADNIKCQQRKFAKRGEYEIASIKKARHIFGRTEWDYACCKSINPEIEYYKCNETLRSSFYENAGKWSLENC